MNNKQKIITSLIACIIGLLVFITGFVKTNYDKANVTYQIFLNGKDIGSIANDQELYDLIDKNQQAIKEKYGVNNVYPPNNFEIVKRYTYNTELTSAKEIYNKIEDMDDFTIRAYVVTIKPKDAKKKTIKINVLTKEIFDNSIHKFITAFVDPEKLDKYMNGNQDKIVDTGKIIEDMYFNEKFKIKEDYVSVNEKIYTDEEELSQYLLFGDQNETKYYTVKSGDTISSVSDANKLNTEEFLIANPKYASEDSLLAINDKVNVTLINPVISLTYQLYDVSDVEQYFEKKVVVDNSKPYSYNEITQAGVTGITRLTQRYSVTNGENSQGTERISSEVLREKVDQITTKGPTYSPITGVYIDPGSGWGWPTNSGYMITSPFGWRWGSMHDAIDISGTGFNSPIYAANDGVVVQSNPMCYNCSAWSLGNYVVIKHADNYYTMYAHLNSLGVGVGQQVKKGDVIGRMGETGNAYGYHLHFALSIGEPYNGSYRFLNPLTLYQ